MDIEAQGRELLEIDGHGSVRTKKDKMENEPLGSRSAESIGKRLKSEENL